MSTKYVLISPHYCDESSNYLKVHTCDFRAKEGLYTIKNELEKIGVKNENILVIEHNIKREDFDLNRVASRDQEPRKRLREAITNWYLDPTIRKILLLEIHSFPNDNNWHKGNDEKIVLLPLPYSLENSVKMAKNMGGRKRGVFVYMGSEKNDIQLEFMAYKDKLEAYLLEINEDKEILPDIDYYMHKAADWLVFRKSPQTLPIDNTTNILIVIVLIVILLTILLKKMNNTMFNTVLM